MVSEKYRNTEKKGEKNKKTLTIEARNTRLLDEAGGFSNTEAGT